MKMEGESTMGTPHVAVREFREDLADDMLGAKPPFDVTRQATRQGDTAVYDLPLRRPPTPKQIAALSEASALMQEEMKAKGVTEEDIFRDLEELHAANRK